MPTLSLINFNIVCAVLGGFISIFGLVSYLCKETFYLSEALISLLAGILFSPHAANFIRPEDYALHSEQNLDAITMHFTRLVLGVQLVLAGVQLPKRYLQIEWRSLALLLGPGMAAMWISSSLIIWAMVPNFKFLHSLIVGACVTPTDPVLSNSIVKGKFADKHVPQALQRIIVAESGANDGLGYPFLFFGIYLLKYTGMDGQGFSGGTGRAMALWFYETWAYTIILSVVYGAVVGWISRKLLHWAEEKHFVDRESFLVFAIALALFIVGTCGLIGTDDLLACFIAGNVFTQDDWFRLETMDDSLQPTIDMLLNLSVFMWFGAVCPWSSFLNNPIIPLYRLVFLGILILIVRRLPIILVMHKYIRQIEYFSQAAFVGFFGPIGVGAIFYLSISKEFLKQITVDNHVREDAQQVIEVIDVVVWFLVICSIIVHGMSIPVGKAGYNLPRTLSNAISSSVDVSEPIPISIIPHTHSTATAEQTGSSFRPRKRSRTHESPHPPVFRIGHSVIPPPSPVNTDQPGVGIINEPERPVNLATHNSRASSDEGHERFSPV
ncbi:Cation/H+ exchanger [Penicillium taxi]|uniref:Cation/H+ exchanger n=1 Tax=Penicillium taxi TaxID=168475 RepID=UPI0025454CB1|nr:Cation/H+ exchanger [Penicillium taxi]KAJ5899812.1 Cation/H+ exchanger [Penicillium taxi]